MAMIDTKVCIAARCDFVCKEDVEIDGVIIPKGTCLAAYVRRIPKDKICISNVDIRVSNR